MFIPPDGALRSCSSSPGCTCNGQPGMISTSSIALKARIDAPETGIGKVNAFIHEGVQRCLSLMLLLTSSRLPRSESLMAGTNGRGACLGVASVRHAVHFPVFDRLYWRVMMTPASAGTFSCRYLAKGAYQSGFILAVAQLSSALSDKQSMG